MDDLTPIYLLLSALGVGALALVGGPLARAIFDFLTERTRRHFQDLLITFPPQRAVALALAAVGAVVVFIGVVFGTWSVGVVLLLAAPAAAEFGFRIAKIKRREQIDLQLPDCLMTIANSMRSGLTLVQALEMTEENSFPPISKELGIVLSENRLGTSIEESFDRIAQRIESRYLDTAVDAIAITRRTGGNVAETLERIADTIRTIMRIENQIDAMTSQGRMEGIVMGLMPFVAIGGFYLFDKSMITPLFKDPIGHCILVAIILCDIAAIIAIKKLMAIDV